MKIILGIILGASLVFAGTAFAASQTGIQFVNAIGRHAGGGGLEKYYDYDADVICYVATPLIGSGGDISCVKMPAPAVHGQG